MPPFVYTCGSSFTHAHRVVTHVIHDAAGKGYVVVNFAGSKRQCLFSSKEKISTVRDSYRGNSCASKSQFFYSSMRISISLNIVRILPNLGIPYWYTMWYVIVLIGSRAQDFLI